MRSSKLLRLGTLTFDAEGIAFEPAPSLAFEAGRHDEVAVGVHFAYRELSEDRETARIRITAELDGQPPQTFETSLRDNPAVDDSRRGFVSVPIRVGSRGELRGRFVVEAVYEVGSWTGREGAPSSENARAEGTFTLRVA